MHWNREGWGLGAQQVHLSVTVSFKCHADRATSLQRASPEQAQRCGGLRAAQAAQGDGGPAQAGRGRAEG